MSFIGVVLTIIFVLMVFKLVKLYIQFNMVYRPKINQREEDRKTLGGLIILLMIFFFAFSSEGDNA